MRIRERVVIQRLVAGLATLFCSTSVFAGAAPGRYSLSMGETAGAVRVEPVAYDAGRGFGYEPGVDVRADARGATADTAFSLTWDLPEGVYRVKVTVPAGAEATVKAGTRQLQALKVRAEGGDKTVEFTVFTRTPAIPGGKPVVVKDREKDLRRWSSKLTLEFCGPGKDGGGAVVSAVEIAPAPADTRVVYLVGDSTVADQRAEPWASWGQMLPVMLRNDVAVANHAESGESLTSFLGARRWDKVLATLKAGDVVLIQMGHNDQKLKGEGVGPWTTYKANLEKLVRETRERGGVPVVVTSVERHRVGADGKAAESLGDYPAVVRKVAEEQGVGLVDLNATSRVMYEALGPGEPLSPQGVGPLFTDKTHHTGIGAWLLARCVVETLRHAPETADLVSPSWPEFDPAHPGKPSEVVIPSSLDRDKTKPDGN
jgi:lysophospholipase L1-like esterase